MKTFETDQPDQNTDHHPADPATVLFARHMDEIDGAIQARAWLVSIYERRRLDSAFAEMKTSSHRNDGRTDSLWYRDRLIAVVSLLRDASNFTVVAGFELPGDGTAG